MYKVVTQEELKNTTEFTDYKLCYIDEIPETYSDWTEESKKLMESEEYKKWKQEYDAFRDKMVKEHGIYSYNPTTDNPYWNRLTMEELPNPEREHGRFYAYFTPLDLKEQWGDDWNDAPYDCNAGIPYDEITLETEEKDGLRFATKRKEYTIIMVPFDVSYNCVFPSEYGYNTPFSVQDINNTAVAWMYNGESVIHAGVNPYEFVERVKKF